MGSVTIESGNTFTWTSNTANENDGGAIYSEGSVTVSGTQKFGTGTAIGRFGLYDGNSALKGFGGAIFSKGTVQINSGQSFLINKCDKRGGAIYSLLAVTINGKQTFQYNTAEDGGAISSATTVTVNPGVNTGEVATFLGNLANEFNNGAGRGGGAIYGNAGITITASTNAALKTVFTLNKAQYGGALFSNGEISVKNGDFQKNEASIEGGAIDNFSAAKAITVENSYFKENKATTTVNNALANGGSIQGGGAITISTTTFENCNSKNDGGAIYGRSTVTITASTFNSNAASASDSTLSRGGAVYALGDVKVTSSQFKSNSAKSSGGAIRSETKIETDGTTNSRTIFELNKSGSNGGALRSVGSTTVTSTTFNNPNTALYGGAIYSSDDVTINKEVSFASQKATAGSGGAIYSAKAVKVLAADANFEGNSAAGTAGYGGAIYATGAVTFNYDALFPNNKNSASKDGGIIYSSDSITFEGKCTVQSGSSVGNGGAFYSKKDLQVKGDASLNNCNAGGHGGFVYSEQKITFAKLKASNVNSGGNGSAIYAKDAVTISGVAEIFGYGAKSGGAIYSGSTVDFKGVTEDASYAVKIYEGSASSGDGGAIFSKGKLTISGSAQFNNMMASNKGGALYSEDDIELKSNVNIYGMTAAAGGAIYTSKSLTIGGTATINGGSSSGNGGAIYAVGAVTIDGLATFSGLSSSQKGGSIYSEGAVTLKNGCSFNGGSSGTDGGAVYCVGAFKVNGADASFSNLAANGKGGSIYCKSTVTIDKKAEFKDGHSQSEGGAIYATQVTISGDLNVLRIGSSTGNIYSTSTVSLGATATFSHCSGSSIDSAENVDIESDASFSNLGGTNGAAIRSGASVTIKGSANFESMGVSGNGGAISAVGDVTIGGVATFKSMGAKMGGAIKANKVTFSATSSFESMGGADGGGAIYASSDVLFKGATTFKYMNANSGKGGAIYSAGSVTFNAKGTFEGISSSSDGGCIYAMKQVQFDEDASFTGCTSNGNGGGIFSKETVTIEGSSITFKNNKAVSGGAIYSEQSVVATIDTKSAVGDKDGGIFVGDKYKREVVPSFELNEASNQGQAIYISSGDSILTNIAFKDNYKGAGVGSVYVHSGSLTIAPGSPDFITSDVVLPDEVTFVRSKIDVDVQCVNNANMPVEDKDGKTTCKKITEQNISELKFKVTDDGTHNRFALRDSVIAASGVKPSNNTYVRWTVSPAKRDTVHDVDVIFSGLPTDTYTNLYSTSSNSGAFTNNGFTPDFAASTMTFAKQDADHNDCAKDDPAPCWGNGYCLNIDATTHLGYCSCMSGYYQLNCEKFATPTPAAIEATSASFIPTLNHTVGPKVTMNVVIPTMVNDNTVGADSYSKATEILFGGNKDKACNYPNKDKSWIVSTAKAADNKWYDTYTATFSYLDLQRCGLSRVDVARTDFATFNNSLTIERTYLIQNGRFSIPRVGKIEHPFSIMFPKNLYTTSDIKVKNNTVEFFASASEISYSMSTHKWKVVVSTIIANEFVVTSLFDRPEDSKPTVTNNPFTDDRNFNITSKEGTKVAGYSGPGILQEFEFSFDDCKAAAFKDFKLKWKVGCVDPDDKEECVNPAKPDVEILLSLHSESACPVSETYVMTDKAVKLYGLKEDLSKPKSQATSKTLFGSSEDVFVAVDFSTPVKVQTVKLVQVCGYPTPVPKVKTASEEVPTASEEEVPLPPCPTHKFPSLSLLDHHTDHRVAFRVNAGELKTQSGTTVNTFVIQVDVSIEYTNGFETSKRIVSYTKEHSSSTLVQVGGKIENPIVEDNHEEEIVRPGYDASSSSILSTSMILLVSIAFLAL
eukprot:TRINITY_DN126_c0_g1_i4.p1 TRINITY_DN126_c0_g1~~TRINITY_DN126_c0_g1_i4.p1  ORF type:complete len:1826 (-),score=574.15 TRINITY_DN126_c0_g1_i4:87-5564(-)